MFDLVALDQAGDLLVQTALDQIDPTAETSFIKNNVDHYTGATFAAMRIIWSKEKSRFLKLFFPRCFLFVTRQIFAGAGRVGTHIDPYEGEDTGLEGQIIRFLNVPITL